MNLIRLFALRTLLHIQSLFNISYAYVIQVYVLHTKIYLPRDTL